MPKAKQTNQVKIPDDNKLTCGACGHPKNKQEYYVSYNLIHSTGRIPYCKKCLKDMICNEQGIVELSKLQETLRLIDKPFLYDWWKISLEDEKDTFGTYMKNLALIQNRQLCWKDSIFQPQLDISLNYDNTLNELNKKISQDKEFIITDEMEDKWGIGYESREYQAFEKKYNALRNNYQQKTAMHTEALLKYIRYSVKEEFATAKGEVTEAGKWGDLASKAATAAKINPSQLTKADLSDGLSTFSELAQAVEKEVDIIPILPRFKYRPNDALDFNIWCYINYARDLSGLPLCEYEDVYAFYDKRKADYIAQYGDPYGIFTNDTSEKNRDKIKKFIKEDENDSI